MGVDEAEDTAEKMDEAVHRLQYTLDHTRRLLEGSETKMYKSLEDITSPNLNGRAAHPLANLSQERQQSMEKKLRRLGRLAGHLLEHIESPAELDVETILEIHHHIDEVGA